MAWDPDLGDEPTGALRDEAPDILSPIDPDAPVSGHHPPAEAPAGPSQAPEQDWLAAEPILYPVLRPRGTSGFRLGDLDATSLASEGLRSHAQPVLDDGPSGLAIGYVLQTGAFDAHVNADHLLAWGAGPEELRAAAMGNLERWSATAAWTEEVSGTRRLVSSASGDGGDAARILLSAVRRHLAETLGEGARVLVGLPERDLLVAAALRPDDEEFGPLFAAFVRGHSEGSDQPLDDRVHELVGGELRPYEG
ncbi:MAG: hypothetical protein ABI555_07565 [Chloroflexota bacterium]